jgi:hypothetical protein
MFRGLGGRTWADFDAFLLVRVASMAGAEGVACLLRALCEATAEGEILTLKRVGSILRRCIRTAYVCTIAAIDNRRC